MRGPFCQGFDSTEPKVAALVYIATLAPGQCARPLVRPEQRSISYLIRGSPSGGGSLRPRSIKQRDEI
jgi:hypothetical protein